MLEFPQQARGKGGAVSKLMESMAADEDFEPNQDSSFSEDENPPVSAQPERPCTPGETPFTFPLVRALSLHCFPIYNCCFMTKSDFIFLSMHAIKSECLLNDVRERSFHSVSYLNPALKIRKLIRLDCIHTLMGRAERY